ncbi:MAG: SIMPL domain-containing protein, partial [Chloroflexota bacterium]
MARAAGPAGGIAGSPGGAARAITVVGEGKVRIKPDIATVRIGVETVSGTVKEATTQASQTMERVLAALKAAGVDAKDMQTSGYSIWTDRNFGPEGRGKETVRYRVNSNLQITTRDLDKVGGVIDAAIEAGANAIHGIQFSLAEPAASGAEARAKAVESARTKAAELARLTG